MIKDIYQYTEESMVQTLKGILGNSQPVIRGYQGSPEPDIDYLVVTTLDVARTSTERSFNQTEEGLVELNVTLLRAMIDITGYGESCYRLMQSALSELELPSFLDTIHYKYGISLNTLGQIQRNPELRGTDYVQRCTTTIELTTTLYHSRDIDWFDTVQYQGVYKAIDGRLVLEANDTVSADDT